MIEEWKDIPDFEGVYQISNFGKVRSLKYNKSRILKNILSSNGYYYVNLYKNKKLFNKRIHQLVAMAFFNHIPEGNNLVIDHIDNNKQNNNIENLQIITHGDNIYKGKKDSNNYSKLQGVSFHKTNKKWQSSIQINGKKKHLGYFITEAEAFEARKKVLNN